MKIINSEIRNSKFGNFHSSPTSPEGACRPDMVADVFSYKRFEVSGLRPPKSEICPKREQGRIGKDGPDKYSDVLASKSVKLQTKMKIRNSKIQKTSQLPNFPGMGLVVQKWSWTSSLISNSKYRGHCPEGARFTPKGGNAGLGKPPLVDTGA